MTLAQKASERLAAMAERGRQEKERREERERKAADWRKAWDAAIALPNLKSLRAVSVVVQAQLGDDTLDRMAAELADLIARPPASWEQEIEQREWIAAAFILDAIAAAQGNARKADTAQLIQKATNAWPWRTGGAQAAIEKLRDALPCKRIADVRRAEAERTRRLAEAKPGVPAQETESAAELPAQAAPQWNRERGELTIGDRFAKRIQNIRQATNAGRILDVFEEENWPERIDDPLPDGRDAYRLKAAIASLNRGLIGLRFSRDGTGEGIRWKRTE
jgi:hypothetical protein